MCHRGFNKTIILLEVAGYEMIIIYHFISSAPTLLLNNLQHPRGVIPTSKSTHTSLLCVIVSVGSFCEKNLIGEEFIDIKMRQLLESESRKIVENDICYQAFQLFKPGTGLFPVSLRGVKHHRAAKQLKELQECFQEKSIIANHVQILH